MRKRTYRAVAVKHVGIEQLGATHDQLILGCDAAKVLWCGAWMTVQGEVVQTIRWDQVEETGVLLTQLQAWRALALTQTGTTATRHTRV